MKQKQANIIEAHLARDQNKVAADQSRTVMIFTIFTIIFLPLSFFASVFGINAREWSGGDNGFLPLHNIFTYMISISLAVIIVALLAAFSRPARKLAIMIWRKAAKPFIRCCGRGPREERPARGNAGMADPEKTAVDAQIRRNEERLSTISRRKSNADWETGWEMNMMSRLPNGLAR